ncbi:MAG: methanogenesis marker 2 protein, partial [Methanomassiliicoccaceae archaeon]|nr:methanogenesis marker 2 protein [Methanomassiliicoccaceae archaeon]
MDLDGIVSAIRGFPGITRKNTVHEIVHFLPTSSFANVIASEGEDAAAISYGDDCLLFAGDGIMESLVKTDPFYAGYFAVLVNVNDIAAMGGRPLAMVDIISMNDGKICSKLLRGMERAVRKFNVPIVGGHTHPDCGYSAIDISILGVVPRSEMIRSSTANAGDDIVFAIDLDGFFPDGLRYAYDTTTRKEDKFVQEQMEMMCTVAKERLTTAGKDMSNPGCIGTLGMLLESSGKGGVVDVDRIPRPNGVDFMQWILAYQGYGFILTCEPKNSGRLIELFSSIKVDAAVVGKVNDSPELTLRCGDKTKVLFDFSKDIITG